jgi:hopene-associated glycosyltransferase HpnB
MLIALTGVSVAMWVGLLVGRGRFWSAGPTLGAAAPQTRAERVTVVIPARDEAEHVVETLRSLLGQRFEGEVRVVLVDDNSSDGTGELARGLHDPRLRVVAGQPLAAGWSGKMWAVHQGLQQPEARAADYVLLTDADIVHAPGHVAALVAKAAGEQIELVSEMVRLRCQSFAERATMPAFIFFFQMLYPFRWVGERRRRTAAAAGGTMLVSRRALDAIGGVERIRAALIDDVALAREVKRAGYRIWLGHAEEAVSGRSYAGFGEVWTMIARTAYVQLRYSPLALAGSCAGMALLYLTPVLATLHGTGLLRWLGVAAWAMMAAAIQPTLRRYRQNPLWGAALPAIAMFYMAATCGSAVRFYQGRGGNWKNRSYPAGA